MSKKARRMPDGNHNFIELRRLWKQGTFTLEECVTQLLHAMLRFEKRKTQLDFKLLPYQPIEEEFQNLQSYESLKAQADSQALMDAMKKDKSAAYRAMDFALDHYATLEFRFIQMERECEEMIRKLDSKSSHLN